MAITLNRGIKSGIFYNVCQQPEKPMKCKFDCTVVAVPIMYYKTPALCHLFTTVRVPMLFAIMPFPVLRSMMSKIISKSEQGEWVQAFYRSHRTVSVCVCRVRVHWRAAGPGNFSLHLQAKHSKFLFSRAKSDFRPHHLCKNIVFLFSPLCVCVCLQEPCLPVSPSWRV